MQTVAPELLFLTGHLLCSAKPKEGIQHALSFTSGAPSHLLPLVRPVGLELDEAIDQGKDRVVLPEANVVSRVELQQATRHGYQDWSSWEEQLLRTAWDCYNEAPGPCSGRKEPQFFLGSVSTWSKARVPRPLRAGSPP